MKQLQYLVHRFILIILFPQENCYYITGEKKDE